MKKQNVIICADTGVDDATLITMAGFDPKINIELISISDGNIPMQQCTNNTLYVLDLMDKDIPVVPGLLIEKRYDKAAKAAQKRAEEMHGRSSLGGLKVPNTVHHKQTDTDIADAMLKILKAQPHKIRILACAPLTNVAYLFNKHPEAVELVKDIIVVGGSFGLPGQPDHISYNAGTDPKAYDKVIHSGARIVIVPSLIGRTFANFSSEQVEELGTMGNYGKFLAKTFETYWEKGFTERFVSNNDVCSYLYTKHKRIFTTKKFDVFVDTTQRPGKLTRTPNAKSKIRVVTKLNRKAFLKIMFKKIIELRDFNYTEKV